MNSEVGGYAVYIGTRELYRQETENLLWLFLIAVFLASASFPQFAYGCSKT